MTREAGTVYLSSLLLYCCYLWACLLWACLLCLHYSVVTLCLLPLQVCVAALHGTSGLVL